jgi:hypothetical protein
MMLQHYNHLKRNMVGLVMLSLKDSCFYFANVEMKKSNEDSDDSVAEHF